MIRLEQLKTKQETEQILEITSEAACQLDFQQVWQVCLTLDSNEMFSFYSSVIFIVINLCPF